MAKKKKKKQTRPPYEDWAKSTQQQSDNIHKELYRLFLRPLLGSIGTDENANIWRVLRIFFGEDYRTVKEFRVVKPISKIPGDYMHRGGRKLPYGAPLVTAHAGWRVMIRIDERIPSEIHAEFYKSWDYNKSYVFVLTPEQYRTILEKNLEEIKMDH